MHCVLFWQKEHNTCIFFIQTIHTAKTRATNILKALIINIEKYETI